MIFFFFNFHDLFLIRPLFIEFVRCRLRMFRANKTDIISSLKYSRSGGKNFLARQRKRTWNRTFQAKHETAWEKNMWATYTYNSFFDYFAIYFSRNSSLWFMRVFRPRVPQSLYVYRKTDRDWPHNPFDPNTA